MNNPPSYTALQVTEGGQANVTGTLGLALNSGHFSIGCWLQYDGYASDAVILEREGEFAFRTQDNGFIFHIVGQAPLSWQAKDKLGDDWVFACITFDDGSVRLYVNGEFQHLVAIRTAAVKSDKPLIIGSGLQGLLRSVSIYNVDLSADQVRTAQFNTLNKSLTAAHFDFTQSPPKDTGPKGLRIDLLTGASSVQVTPCIKFVNGSYIYPMHDGAVNPGGQNTDSYSVQAWVHLDEAAPTQHLVVNSDLGSDTGIDLRIEQNLTDKKFYLISNRGAPDSGNSVTSNVDIPMHSWTNVATTFDGKTLTVYVNGRAAGTKACGPISTSRGHGDIVLGAAFSDTEIGGINSLHGCLSHVTVWNISLTQTQIAQYLSTPPDPGTNGLLAAYRLTGGPLQNDVSRHPAGLIGAAYPFQHILASNKDRSEIGSLTGEIGTTVTAAQLAAWRAGADLKTRNRVALKHVKAARQTDIAAFQNQADRELMSNAYDDLERRLGTFDIDNMPLFFTNHIDRGRRFFVAHDSDQSYVVWEEEANATDDCTAWKIQLTFIAIGGALTALFGVKTRLTASGRNVILRLLKKSAILRTLSMGRGITALGIFQLMVAVYSSGEMWNIIKALVDIGFFGIIQVMIRAGAKLIGIGEADTIATLTATAAEFGVAYASRPKSCDPLPAVTLNAIKFWHDPTGTAVQAIRARKNGLIKIKWPEWQLGDIQPAECPLLYSIARITNNKINIQASFSINTQNPTTISIQAVGDPEIGNTEAQKVHFINGQCVPEFITFEITHGQLAKGGTRAVDTELSWQSQAEGVASWNVFASSKHRIYLALDNPNGPWKCSSELTETQLPWIEALEFSCAWAAGSTTADAILTAITTHVNSALGLKYDTDHGHSVYTSSYSVAQPEEDFFLHIFIELLHGKPGYGHIINCKDTATIVVTFANLLGSRANCSRMGNGLGAFFELNKTIPIGSTDWLELFDGIMSYHEVAWLNVLGWDGNIYDACLKLDGSDDPWNWTAGAQHNAVLPLNIPFSTPERPNQFPIKTPFKSQTYRERVAANSADGIGSCKPTGAAFGSNNGRRPVV